LGYPLLSRQWVQLHTSNLVSTFIGPIQINTHKNFVRKKGAWAYSGADKIFGVPLLSQERVKLRTSNFVRSFIGRSEKKNMKNFGNSSRGRSQGVPKIFPPPHEVTHMPPSASSLQSNIYSVSIKFARWKHDCGRSLLSTIALFLDGIEPFWSSVLHVALYKTVFLDF